MPGIYEQTIDLRFDGGLNITTPPTELSDKELVTCENFLIDRDGQLRKRAGFFRNNTAMGNPAYPKWFLGYDHNVFRYLVREYGTTNIWNISQGNQYFVTGTITQHAVWSLWINGTMYIGFNGNMGIRTLGGTSNAPVIGASTITNSPQSNVATWHKSRIFTDVLGVPGRIAFSDPNAPGTWQTTSTIDVGVNDKDIITALVSLGDLLLIFKRSSVWTLYVQGGSPADWVVRRIHETLGCVQTIGTLPYITVGNECYFISPNGIFKTNGASFVNIGEKIWPINDEVYNSNTITSFFRITRWNNFLLFVINGFGLTQTGKNLVYNLENKAWSSWTFLGGIFEDLFSYPASASSVPTLYGTKGDSIYYTNNNAAGYYDTYLGMGLNTYSDGLAYNVLGTGSAYTSTFQTKEFMGGIDRFLRLKWVGAEYISRTPGPSLSIVSDGVAGPSRIPGFHATLRKGYKIPGAGRHHTVALKCTHALTSPFEFYRSALHLTPKVPILASGTP
jgi:hypothetical protein